MVLFSVNLNAQTTFTQTIKGVVTDLDSEMPLIGATVVMIGSSPIVGSITDIDGRYIFKSIPIGRHSFKISFIGYEDVYLNEILLESGKEVVMDVAMTENISELETVVIIAKDDKSEAINQMTTVSANQITIESTSRIAAGINDPGRTIQSLAGVATSSDKTNELVIRGNSPRGVLWRMEGVEIPNPNHFSSEGGSGGGVSALSTQVLANSDFITSAFPAEYGNAISGVYDLRLRKGNSEKREYTVQLGVLGLQVAAEGPFKKGSQASYLFNYRYSTFSLLNKVSDLTIGGSIPTWQDLSFKIFLPTKKAGHFSIWGLGGNSIYEDLAVQDSTQWKYKSDYRQEVSINSLGIIGLTHNYLFDNNKTYIKTTLSGSSTNNDFLRDTLDYNYNPSTTLKLLYRYNTMSVNSFVNHKFNAKHLLRFGANLTNRGYNISEFDLYSSADKQESEGNTYSSQLYLQWKYRITNKFEIISGIHFSYLMLNKKHAIEPRLGLKWKLNKKNIVSLGFGLHSKAEPVSVYFSEEHLADGTISYPNKNLDFTKSAHLVLGYNWNFANDFRLKSEIYYQHIYNVPIDISDITGTRSSLNFRTRIPNTELSNEGTGINYGVEITLEKFFSNNWYALVTSSIFDSKYTMPGFEERNTLFNSNYIYNVVAGKEFCFGSNDQNVIGLNIRTTWRGGYRNIPYNEAESINQDKPIYDYDEAYSQRLPDYYRIDLGINYSYNTSDKVWKVSIDIQNITNAKNINQQYYNSELNQISNSYYQGIVPNVNLIVEF
ncbi:MAG: TonB-dependent receptor [Bacteroidales bacterium]|nr:TonB-dependent receptor [Bacteroidales bacterium]